MSLFCHLGDFSGAVMLPWGARAQTQGSVCNKAHVVPSKLSPWPYNIIFKLKNVIPVLKEAWKNYFTVTGKQAEITDN